MRDPITGTGAVVVALVVAALLLQVAAVDDSQVYQLLDRVGKLTHEIFDLEEKIDARVDPKRIQRAGSLEARVEALEGPTCEHENYQCGGNDPQCVSNLFVCDGLIDCRNGDDEKHCVVPLKAGDQFIGEKEFDHCGRMNPDHITVTVDSVTTFAFFTSFPKLSLTLSIHVDREDADTELAISTVGFYNPAKHQIVLQALEKDNLAMVGQFDGHNFDRFVGESMSEGSREVCARFIYNRQH